MKRGGTPAPRGGRTAGLHERYVPLVYFAAAVLVTVLVLPSTLRPPQQEPPSSGRIDPDVPPDDSSLIVSMSRASSGTAGAGLGAEGLGGARPLPGPSAAAVPRKGVCFGNPARQTESLYSAPCAPSWQGDNGGATSRGVTRDDVRVAMIMCGAENAGGSYRGPVPRDWRSASGEGLRNIAVWQAHLNDHFQFYGRYLQFYVYGPDCNPSSQNAAVVEADATYHLFGVHASTTNVVLEAVRRRIVGVSERGLDPEVYSKHAPYVYSFEPDGGRLFGHVAEYVCKRLAGRPAVFAGDDSYRTTTRKFGMLYAYNAQVGETGARRLPGYVKDRCGEEVRLVTASGLQSPEWPSVIARFKVDGVTTVIMATDQSEPGSITTAADGAAYRPEWFISGQTLQTLSVSPKLFAYSKEQWAHAFGLDPTEIQRPNDDYDYYRAYREYDPDNVPNSYVTMFWTMLQWANGVQMAGPRLSPETFAQGQRRMGYRWYHDTGRMGGGYTSADHSYIDDLQEIWWDNDARDYRVHKYFPGHAAAPGAYVFVGCGMRHRPDAWPTTQPEVFDRSKACEIKW